MQKKDWLPYLLVIAVFAILLTACGGKQSSGNALESQAQAQDTASLVTNQPVPHFNSSQLRQNLIEIETALANGVQSTSFFFNQGVTDPIYSCPSVGAPIPVTDQLTNPDQIVTQGQLNSGGGNVTLSQQDPTGIYPGSGTGTFVLCITPGGKVNLNYWEGFVGAVFAPAVWDAKTHTVKLIGPPAGHFTK